MFTICKCIERLWNKYGYSFGIETINMSRHSRVVPNPIVDQTRQSLYLFTDQNGAKTQQFNLGRPTFLYSLYMGLPPPPPPPAGDYFHKQRLNFVLQLLGNLT